VPADSGDFAAAPSVAFVGGVLAAGANDGGAAAATLASPGAEVDAVAVVASVGFAGEAIDGAAASDDAPVAAFAGKTVVGDGAVAGDAPGTETAAGDAPIVAFEVKAAAPALSTPATGGGALVTDFAGAEADAVTGDAAGVGDGVAAAGLAGDVPTPAGAVTEVRASAFTLTGPATASVRAATEVGLASNAFTSSAISPASVDGSATAAARGPAAVADRPPSMAAKIMTSPTAAALAGGPPIAAPGV
jgi:hypothetical protein